MRQLLHSLPCPTCGRERDDHVAVDARAFEPTRLSAPVGTRRQTLIAPPATALEQAWVRFLLSKPPLAD